MALHSDNGDHNLTAMDIENDDEGDRSSLVHSSSSDTNVNVLSNHGPQHLETASPYAPTFTSPRQKKPTNLPLLACSYLSALTTGATTYAFSFYSNALKTSLHLTQNQLDTLSSATFCAGILSWMPGMIVDSFGARTAMALGGTSNSVMLSLYWLLATERVPLHDLDLLILVLSALGVLIFVGCALVTGSVFKVIVEGCGEGTKGKAVGCAKGYVGVGSGVYVCLFGALFGSTGGGAVAGPAASFLERVGSSVNAFPAMKLTSLLPPSSWAMRFAPQLLASSDVKDPETRSLDFLLMAAAFSFVASTLPALLLLPKKTSSRHRPRDGTRSIHFRVIYAGLIMLGVWVVGSSLMELREEELEKHNHGSGGSSPGDSNNTASDGGDGGDGGVPALNPATQVEEAFIAWMGHLPESDPIIPHGQIDTAEFSEQQANAQSYSNAVMRVGRRLSSASIETHWGSFFFLLLLWWGPALSLLVIPPRKDGGGGTGHSSGEEEEVAFNYDSDGENDRATNGDGESEGEEDTFLQDDLPMSNGSRSLSVEKDSSSGRDKNLLQMLRTGSAWLMAWTFVILVGGGTVMTNNVGQMTEALGFSSNLTPASLALFSAAQGASRVVTGIASELALKWNLPWFCGCLSTPGGGVPRPVFLVLASLVSAASHFILAISTSEEGFALGVTLSGVAFGMVWPMMVLITGEVFGTRNLGANYLFFDGGASAVGTLLLSKFVAQEVYDEHIASHGDPGMAPTDDGEFKCFGTECFRMSHMIVSLLSLTCIVSSVGLIRSTRDVYQHR
ncbi:hypothetical protein ACHAXT_009472 [Thalassiosira profunda]